LKASMILGLLHRGASFDSLAVVYSDDKSAKTNKGDLYYFSVGTMVPAFEQAAFSLKVGEITASPVRTQFGLHIIKLNDRKPSPGEIRCSHIMIQFSNPNPSPADTLAAYARIRPLKDSLDHGVDF
jgi:peptidyl-prolyl cis-trans isomerase SurA